MPFADVDKVAKQIPPALDMTLDKALEESETLREMEQNDPKVKELLSVARRLEGMTRHASVHAAGVVIAPKAITEYAPLYKGARDEIVTQWSMKEIERVGLLKMDFLGLSTLTLIFDAIAGDQADHRRRARHRQRPARRCRRPIRSSRTAQTYGIFQFESSGMRDILRKSKPQRLDDLIALNALYRPGPLRSGMVDDYIARKQGKTEIKYELPELEPILADTYGVIAYQEQVMRISNVRRRLHARRSRPAAQGDGQEERRGHGEDARQVRRGRQEAGHQREEGARTLFDLMEHFAGYGFNKSHSTAYAFLAYQTAYLKANYPWHFAAALLTIEAQNTDKLALYLGECRDRAAFRCCRPTSTRASCASRSSPSKGVRFGLTAIKNVGEGAIESLLSVRTKQGRITLAAGAVRGSRSAAGQQARVREPDQGRRVRFAGAAAPRYDGLPSLALRPRLLAAIDAACEHGARAQRDREQGQGSLFGAERRRSGGRSAAPTAVCRCRRRRHGPRPSSSASRRRRSACTGAAIRSIATPTR